MLLGAVFASPPNLGWSLAELSWVKLSWAELNHELSWVMFSWAVDQCPRQQQQHKRVSTRSRTGIACHS